MAEKVSRIVVRVKWGKSYERALMVAKELNLVLANPRHICATRFAADERKVYKNVATNWLPLLKVIGELAAKETNQGDKKILANVVKLIRSQVSQ
jgi:hypothetical protein